MVVLFKELREIVAKTDAIQIMVTSIGDVVDSWSCMDMVPDRYNDMEVIGFLEIYNKKTGYEFHSIRL